MTGSSFTPYRIQFMFSDPEDDLDPTEAASLRHILQSPPGNNLLPGEGGVLWKTPAPSLDLEFGDGVAVVFKNLSVSSLKQQTQVTPTNTTHIALSANSTPFVPYLPIPYLIPTIPIPIPNPMTGIPVGHQHPIRGPQHPMIGASPGGPQQPMAGFPGGPQQQTANLQGGHQQVHINNLTLNYNGLYNNLGECPHVNPPYTVAQGSDGQLYCVPMVASWGTNSHHQQTPQSAGITFGSTPVVSVNTIGRTTSTSEEEEEHKQIVSGSIINTNPVNNHDINVNPSNCKSDSTSSIVQNDSGEQINIPLIVQTNPCAQVEPSKELPPSISSKENINSLPKEISQKSEKFKVDPQSIPQQVQSKGNDKPVIIKSAATEKEIVESQEPRKETAPQDSIQPTSSWAGLFSADKTNTSKSNTDNPNKPTAVITPFTIGTVGKKTQSQQKVFPNSSEHDLGLFLCDYQLNHLSNPLLPRGLINRSNWCFVNSILQALTACPPFYHLLKSLPLTPKMLPGKSKTPMLDSMVEFFSEFSPLEIQEGKLGKSNSGGKKDRAKMREDIVTGIGLEPSYVYKMLLNLEADTFNVVEGRQEDAEEFLTCLLNGLSDEILSLIKLAKNDEHQNINEEDITEGTDDDWQEVGAKGRSCVTRRVADNSNIQTPIQSLALGVCRSCVKAEGGDISATLQPFYTLQLDIQDSEVVSVTDALLANFASEQLDGFICSKTKKEVDATRSLSLEELPPVLILHLKRFVYNGATGGVQKLLKKVTFNVDLEIPKTVLSSECRSNTNSKQRQYKLFSVVYHNGREATKGHYVTDAFQSGYSSWLHCDDSTVQMTGEQSVVQPGPTSTPYLLFYRRADTLAGREGGK